MLNRPAIAERKRPTRRHPGARPAVAHQWSERPAARRDFTGGPSPKPS